MIEPKAGLKRGYYLLNTDGGVAWSGVIPARSRRRGTSCPAGWT
jgi:hypothetical protein